MLEILKESLRREDETIWNAWIRKSNNVLFKQKDFEELNTKFFSGYDFSDVIFESCIFQSPFQNCRFEGAKFLKGEFTKSSRFTKSSFESAMFKGVTFDGANLGYSNLNNCKFENCTLINLDLTFSSLVKSQFFNNCTIQNWDIYGASIWDIDVDKTTKQKDVKVPYREFKGYSRSDIFTIDDVQLGNIIYLLLDNANYTRLLEQSKKKCVLLLGNFSDDYKQHIIQLKEQLRLNDYSAIVFDFESPTTLDLIEAVVLLSLLAKFIVVDLTAAISVPAELQAILSTLTIPVVPIIKRNSRLFYTYTFTNKYRCVLPIVIFDDIKDIAGDTFKKVIIKRANDLFEEINVNKKKEIETIDLRNYKK